MKILYVEDEISHVELTQRTLDDNFKEDFILLHCDTCERALTILKKETDIDIVLSDLRLPDGSGLDLLIKIQKMHMPPAVVLVTGQGDELVAVAALKAGAADYLVKQTDYLHRLPVVITNAVAQNNLAREQAAKLEMEIRYQSLVERTPAVVFLDDIDENETTLYISPRIEELTGFSPEEWKSDVFIWGSHIHPEDQEKILDAAKKTHETGERFEEEYRFTRRDGQIIWIKEDTNLIRTKDGKPLYWQGIMINITKEKDNDAALQRQLKELTVLNAVTTAGTEGTSEDEIIERYVKITSLIYNEICGVLLLNEEGNALIPHPSYYGANIANWKNGTPITQGVTGKCVLTGKAIRLSNVASEPIFIEIATEIQSELCVPIRVNKRIIGVFNVESKLMNAFDKEDEQFLTTVAGNLGTALERLRLFKKEQQRNRELNALYQATKSLAQNLSPKVIAENLLAIMDDLFGYEFASIYLLDEQGQFLVPLLISPKSQNLEISKKGLEMLFTEKRLLGQGILGWVAQHGQAIRSDDVSKENRYLPVIGNIRSELCVPLMVREKVVGAVNIETTTKNAYTAGDENLLTALANSAAIALENAHLYETEHVRRKEADILREATASLGIHIEINPLLDQILNSILKIIPYDSASIFLDVKDGEMEIVAAKGFSNNNNILGKRIPNTSKWRELALIHKTLIMEDVRADPLFEQWEGTENIRGWMGIPMITQDKVVGFINLDSYKVNFFTEHNATLAQTFANSAAIAIENAGLYQNAIKAYDTTLEGWARALELRDRETEGHTRRVTKLTLQLAQYMNIDKADLENIYRGVLLHDIGKMGVPDQILRKTGPLTDLEQSEMRKHPQYAFDLLSPIHYLHTALDIPYCHHEHWDGSGYPRGLKGEEIPLSARIFSIVDVWDALLSNRPYRNAWSKKKVVSYLKEISGTILDPNVVDAFLKMVDEDESKMG